MAKTKLRTYHYNFQGQGERKVLNRRHGFSIKKNHMKFIAFEERLPNTYQVLFQGHMTWILPAFRHSRRCVKSAQLGLYSNKTRMEWAERNERMREHGSGAFSSSPFGIGRERERETTVSSQGHDQEMEKPRPSTRLLKRPSLVFGCSPARLGSQEHP